MRQTILAITIGALILLALPLFTLISGWQWHPLQIGLGNLKPLYWATETVTLPWGILTSMILLIWFLWCLRLPPQRAILLITLIAGFILTGQLAKSLIKNQIQEPRPFVLWLEHEYKIDDQEFYKLSRKQRDHLIDTTLSKQTTIPPWLRQHWQFETGFAFPSGHTMFVASWALLAIGLLWPRKHYVTVIILTLWAVTVMVSRLVLGMHWPTDLIAATIISWALAIFTCWAIEYKYKLQKNN
ncbi:phosphatidylglycerophosphatase B [Neisseria sp. Ec49-e6-T10]|uniref:phosphatidylglycerophosphatase B n=1 Tax=Neisseria sp. Ec49-e6-T10 TaxID=3140744 RepID=UPI003EB79CBE